MKVLLITGSWPPMKCGVGDYSYNLVKKLLTNPETKIAVLTTFSQEIKKMEGVTFFPIMKMWSLSETVKIFKTIKSWDPDIVHIQYPTHGYKNRFLQWILPLIAFIKKKKIIQTWHEGCSRKDAFKLLLRSLIPCTLIILQNDYRKVLNPMLNWAFWGKKIKYIPIDSNISSINLDESQRDVIRSKFLEKQKRLIVFFGLIEPKKRIKVIFEISDPLTDKIVIAGEIRDSEYFKEIENISLTEHWKGKATITGFLNENQTAELLSIADAVILPFKDGNGESNRGSVYAAVANKAFIITTSKIQNGYNSERNIYYSQINNVEEMKAALNFYAGLRRKYNPVIDTNRWEEIVNKHRALYNEILSR